MALFIIAAKRKEVCNMITDAILSLFFIFGRGLITLFPGFYTIPSWADATLEVLNVALFFFPVDLWAVILACILFWLTALLTWAAVEWVYKKAPGVD